MGKNDRGEIRGMTELITPSTQTTLSDTLITKSTGLFLGYCFFFFFYLAALDRVYHPQMELRKIRKLPGLSVAVCVNSKFLGLLFRLLPVQPQSSSPV